MPGQITGIAITDNGNGTANVQIGAFGYTVNLSDLFDQSFDTSTVSDNCRLTYLIGGYVDPLSAEYLSDVNKVNQGLEAKFGNIKINNIVLADSYPTYRINFTVKSGPQIGQTFEITMTQDQFRVDTQDMQTILSNLPAFFRKGGFTTLTTTAIAAVKAWTFRY